MAYIISKLNSHVQHTLSDFVLNNSIKGIWDNNAVNAMRFI